MSFKKPVLNLCKRKKNGFKCTLLYIIPQEVNKYNGLIRKSTILNYLLILYRFGGFYINLHLFILQQTTDKVWVNHMC